jgi:hypothetical protein
LNRIGGAVSYNRPKAQKFFGITEPSWPFDNTTLLLSDAVFPCDGMLLGIANFFLPIGLW